MRKNFKKLLLLLIVASLAFWVPFSTAFGKNVALMTKEELRPIMNDADVVIIDVRSGRDWSSSEFKIQGAVYGDPKQVSKWKDKYSKDKKLVFYCA